MAHILWSTAFSIGVPDVDQEHEELVVLANQMHDLLGSSAPDEDIQKTFRRLTSHTVTHFWNEEALFVNTAYPRAAIHARKHQHLLTILACFQTCLDRSGQYFKLEGQLGFLRDWLMDHITTEDTWLGAYLTRQESPPSVSALEDERG